MGVSITCKNCGHTSTITSGNTSYEAYGFKAYGDAARMINQTMCCFCVDEVNKAEREAERRANVIHANIVQGARKQALLRARTQRRNQTNDR